MTTFLFWNINKKPLLGAIKNLVFNRDVDVLMLTECDISPDAILKTLNPIGTADYYYAPGLGCERIEIFTRFSSEYIQPINEANRITIRNLKIPGLTSMLLAVTHMPSKLRWNETSQSHESIKIADMVRNSEGEVGHSRSVLVGDLNMNPFEAGVVSAAGFHGVMCRDIAKKEGRVVQSRDYPFFYNPMWSLLGDASPGKPGTYYYNRAEHVNFFWNMFDQVLIRPQLLERFYNDRLMILDTDGEISLLTQHGIPDSENLSDHLPVLFDLSL